MKRRTFLHTGAMSLLSAGLPVAALPQIWKSRVSVHHWLQQLTVTLGVRRRMAFLSTSTRLRQQISQTDAFLSARGYSERDSALFFYPDRTDRCFYALAMRHASAGLTDLLVPVLNRQPDGSWKQWLVLTGYQLEALARAASVLSVQSTSPLADLLLPSGTVIGADGTYPTALGSVSTDTRLEKGQATTQIVVRAGRDVVFSEKFVSEHCLSSTPGA